MSERDYPTVMPGKLELSPIKLPEPPEAAPARIDMGVTREAPRRLPTGGLPPWLSPDLMEPMFGQYGEGLDRSLRLPADFPGPAPAGPRGRWGKNDAGVGLTSGDWQLGGAPTMSTSDRFDDPGTRARTERAEQDERDARRRGETTPNPVGDALR